MPNRQNIAIIIRLIKPESLIELLVNWAKSYQSDAPEEQQQSTDNKDSSSSKNTFVNLKNIIAIDGKDVRALQAHSGEVLNFVSVQYIGLDVTMSTEMGLGKGQKNEMVRNVLNTLNLRECVITLEALHCQSETINTIAKQKATALIQIKANQGKLHESIDAQFQELWSLSEPKQGATKEESTAHGRNEQRDAYVLSIKLSDKSLKKWPHLKIAIAIVRERQVKCKTGIYSTSYYVCTNVITQM
ncbi:ISAs1 family transposase [Thorsellia kenyensis]|uniref:ISAs1 family transposase n=1 Tax=Thorsellia kenyensis TaxID=1549888 RepID=A0ABV6C940_9GAMM